MLEEAHKYREKNIIEHLIEIGRESRKWGVVLMLITQSLSDFKNEAKIIREITTSRIFMRAIDKAEHEYIKNFVSADAVDIVKGLSIGEALITTPHIPPIKVRIRPPFCNSTKPTPEQIRQIQRRSEPPIEVKTGKLRDDEMDALQYLRKYCKENDSKMMLAKELQRQLELSTVQGIDG